MNKFYHGDCLFVMNHDIAPESVDLIYLDPPFFTGKVQKGTKKWQPGAMEISFEDSKKFWGNADNVRVMREKAPPWLIHIAKAHPDFASYLYYMMERLQACHKVLKPTGSIYLHCDWRASHYLKMIMDESKVFGFKYFQNEIIWHYTGGGRSKSCFSRKHDVIFWYAKARKAIFNIDTVRVPYKETSGYAKGGIVSKAGKQYLPNPQGTPVDDVWDIPIINPLAKERTGYPTQKPEALLERIILASSNEGDIVLDPFCGCGTAVWVASDTGRQWIGIDISKEALEVTKGREKQLPLEAQMEFARAQYITRDLQEVKELNPSDFEKWVNEFYEATKPYPDKGVDGITQDGIPIQTKICEIKRDKLSQFITDARHHPNVPKPLTRVMAVSQVGFDDGARKRKFEVETEGLTIDLITPDDILPKS